jgi:hypothetical protein
VTVIASGEGGGAGKHYQVLAHLWTLGIRVGWPVAAARREQCGWRWCFGGHEWRGRGRGASGRCGEARGRVNWVEEGREGVLHGEQEAAAGGGRRQWCSGRNSTAFRGW